MSLSRWLVDKLNMVECVPSTLSQSRVLRAQHEDHFQDKGPKNAFCRGDGGDVSVEQKWSRDIFFFPSPQLKNF